MPEIQQSLQAVPDENMASSPRTPPRSPIRSAYSPSNNNNNGTKKVSMAAASSVFKNAVGSNTFKSMAGAQRIARRVATRVRPKTDSSETTDMMDESARSQSTATTLAVNPNNSLYGTALQKNPRAHFEAILAPEACPFLHAQIHGAAERHDDDDDDDDDSNKNMTTNLSRRGSCRYEDNNAKKKKYITAPTLERNEIRVGKVWQEGEESDLQFLEITGFRSKEELSAATAAIRKLKGTIIAGTPKKNSFASTVFAAMGSNSLSMDGSSSLQHHPTTSPTRTTSRPSATGSSSGSADRLASTPFSHKFVPPLRSHREDGVSSNDDHQDYSASSDKVDTSVSSSASGASSMAASKNNSIPSTNRSLRKGLMNDNSGKIPNPNINNNEDLVFDKKSNQQYALKCLHPRILAHADEDDSAWERAATKLVLEGLYLSHLQHPHIMKLRAVSTDTRNAFTSTLPVQFSLESRRGSNGSTSSYGGGRRGRLDAFFLVTDQLGETLEKRLEKWKVYATDREEKERKRRQPKKYPAPLVPNVSVALAMASSTAASTCYADDPAFSSYPKIDLVALKTNYALQILQALAYLHEKGIVVRELRPETIGFCDYPYHHTVQLCDLSSAKEMPRKKKDNIRNADNTTKMNANKSGESLNLIPPEELDLRLISMTDNSYRRTGTQESRDSVDSSRRSTSGYSSSSQVASAYSETLLGVQTSILARRYMAPEIFGPDGYSTSADIYSWAMIFTELLTDTKPYGSRQLTRGWTKIVNGDLRPSIQKHHFPRALKAVLEHAWQPAHPRSTGSSEDSMDASSRSRGALIRANSKRATAPQLIKSVSIVLKMLEGKGLPWQSKKGNDTNTLASPLSSTQPPSPPQELTLPERAANYRRMESSQPQGWASVWDPRQNRHASGAKVQQDVQAELRGTNQEVFQRRLKEDGGILSRAKNKA